MTRNVFFTSLFVILVASVFLKIYQHNLLINLSYRRQLLERKKKFLMEHKNKLLVRLFKFKNHQNVKKIAMEKLDLRPIMLSQIITVT